MASNDPPVAAVALLCSAENGGESRRAAQRDHRATATPSGTRNGDEMGERTSPNERLIPRSRCWGPPTARQGIG
jgi:hypothetical protein